AVRQILEAASRFEAELPSQPHGRLVPGDAALTAVPVEERFPAGGFASLATRGSIESLLHSQLAFMDPDVRPDLFDARFVRDELLYYARDDSEFARPRLAWFFIFHANLDQARQKHPGLPYQNIMLMLGLLIAC